MKNVISNSDNSMFWIENKGKMARIKELDKSPVARLGVQGKSSDYRVEGKAEDAFLFLSYC